MDIDIRILPEETQQKLMTAKFQLFKQSHDEEADSSAINLEHQFLRSPRFRSLTSALAVLIDECKDKDTVIRKIIFEGGSEQGKSTISQMAAQIYRQQILTKNDIDPEKRWLLPQKARLPFRVELRRLAEWLTSNPSSSIEEYLAVTVKQNSGGNAITINDIQTAVEKSPVLLIFDGLDEIGSDKLRDNVLKAIMECINRLL